MSLRKRPDNHCGCEDCTCDELHVGMYALLDRELTQQECARLSAHIKHCPQCAAAVEAEEQVRSILRKCCCKKAPDTLRERITYSIRIEQTY